MGALPFVIFHVKILRRSAGQPLNGYDDFNQRKPTAGAKEEDR